MGPRPLVAVLLGTDHHPFDRLVQWVAEASRRDDRRWFVQHGSTALPPGLEGAPMLGVDELADLLDRADAVVTHGGPGLIMEARAHGHRPVVVPRESLLGEHVDGHQLLFATRLDRAGLVVVARDRRDLLAVVDHAVAVGRHPTGGSDTADVVSQRFGDLVSALVRAG